MEPQELIFLATLISSMASIVSPGVVIEDSDTHSSSFTMECPASHGIRTRGVSYGKISEGCDLGNKDEHTLIVARKCDLRRKCEVPASNALFGDPCYLVKKELSIQYECVPGIHSDTAWEDGTVHLSKCTQGQVIKILNVFYGRHMITCDSPPTAKNRVEMKCDGHQTCAVPANNVFFGDPCYGVVKYLDVSYSCIHSQEKLSEIHLHEETEQRTLVIEKEKTSVKQLSAIGYRKSR